jgi:hypothetical protein
MNLTPLPAAASWNHRGVRTGFEIAFFADLNGGHRLAGHTTAHESGALWSVAYDVTVDGAWTTVSTHVSSLTAAGTSALTLIRDADGRWTLNGEPRPELDGCVDVDLESSAVTNTLPLHRLELVPGAGIDVPAAFVRADDLRVERLEHRYTLVEAWPERLLVHDESSTFDVACDLEYDHSGLILQYPSIARRES